MTKSTRKVLLSLLMTFIILAAGAGIYKNNVSKKKSTVSKTAKKQAVRLVETASLSPQKVGNKIAIDGRLQAYEKINLSSEVQGILLETSKPFKEGTYFKEGDLLFSIDNENARLNLLAQRSNLLNAITLIMPDLKFDYPQAFDKWKKYLDDFDVTKNVKTLPEIGSEQEKYFVAGKNIYNLFYSIKSSENQLGKYQIYAPFNGVVTMANTFTGQLVSPGANLGTIMNTTQFEVSAPINMIDLKSVNIGQKVKLFSDELGKSWTGTVSRISKVIDPVTQNLPIYISVSGKSLRDGMYLKGELSAKAINNVIPIDKDLIVDQEYVYIVQDSILKKKKITMVKRDNDQAYIKGLNIEDQVVMGTLTGLYEGQKVNISEKKQ